MQKEAKQFQKKLFRLYIETHPTKEQRFFNIVGIILVLAPMAAISCLPFLFAFGATKAGIYTSIVIAGCWIPSICCALVRKKRIFRRILTVKPGDEKVDIIQVENFASFTEFETHLALMVPVKVINSDYLNLIYNWLHNLNILKDGVLKIHTFTGSQLREKYKYEIQPDHHILFVSVKDLHFDDEAILNQYFREFHFLFYTYPHVIMDTFKYCEHQDLTEKNSGGAKSTGA